MSGSKSSSLIADMPGGAAEIAFRRIARRKLIERGYHDDEQIEAKITELLAKGLSIDPKVLSSTLAI